MLIKKREIPTVYSHIIFFSNFFCGRETFKKSHVHLLPWNEGNGIVTLYFMIRKQACHSYTLWRVSSKLLFSFCCFNTLHVFEILMLSAVHYSTTVLSLGGKVIEKTSRRKAFMGFPTKLYFLVYLYIYAIIIV